jgi:uncharacterized protein HemX
MKRVLILLVLAATVSLWVVYAQSKPKTKEEVAACEKKVEATDKQTNGCAKAAEKSCEDKSGFTKTACEKAAATSCLAAAKKSCSN